jgi:hypothetical protein
VKPADDRDRTINILSHKYLAFSNLDEKSVAFLTISLRLVAVIADPEPMSFSRSKARALGSSSRGLS